MSQKSIFILGLSIVLLGAGTSGREELNGVLGESVAFRVKTSTPFASISWSKEASGNTEIIVHVEKSCRLTIPNPAYRKRVSISEDCRELQLSRLKKEDADTYVAEIFAPDGEVEAESFHLQIFRRLLNSDVRVTCTPDGTKNGTWHLNCCTGDWEDLVDISRTSSAQSTDPTRLNPEITIQDLDLKITCTAENLVSRASKTVSSKQVCDGTSGGEERNGIVGESVAFRVKASLPFRSIAWSKIASGNTEHIALVKVGKPCDLQIPSPGYGKRMTISEDCRELHLGHLKEEDAGTFVAEAFGPYGGKVVEFFDLQIFRRLLDSETRVTCTPDGAENRTWQLSCSTEPWDDRVNISWTSSLQSTDPTPGSSMILLQDLDLNVTCRAENLVSRASKTVSLNEVCAGQTENLRTETRLPLWALLCLSKLGSLLLLGCLGLILWVKPRKERR